MSHAPQRGSDWHRWDPHLHAPGTLRNDQFNGDWPAYLTAVEQSEPRVRALGVTDYLSIRGYQAVKEWKAKGRLPDVELIFPNVELRLTIETERKRAINLHLLFSPDDPKHEVNIARLLSILEFSHIGRTFRCTEDDLRDLGKLVGPEQTDDDAALSAGANQFKVDIDQLRRVFEKEEWVRNNCLVAVAAGQGDGVAGLQNDASFYLTQQKIYAFSDIVFSATPSDREYWVGGKTGFNVAYLTEKYGGPRPCLHGSDAHEVARVGAPDQDRYCWIRGDLSFDGLRQAVLEPELRVAIGEQQPSPSSRNRIEGVRLNDADTWFKADQVDLNDGLVAVIGARGSGKTALADVIARGADAFDVRDSKDTSFLVRATKPKNLVGKASVALTWADEDAPSGEEPRALAGDAADTEQPPKPRVRYLSQHFVERLCSADGLARELVGEIERVVFEAIPEPERLGATSFEELRDGRIESIALRRTEHTEAIRGAAATVEREDAATKRAVVAEKTKNDLETKLADLKKHLKKIAPKGKEEQARRCGELAELVAKREEEAGRFRRRIAKLDDLKVAAQTLLESHRRKIRGWIGDEYAGCGFTEEQWESFDIRFEGDVAELINNVRRAAEAAVQRLEAGDDADAVAPEAKPSLEWSLKRLREAQVEAKKALGVFSTQEHLFNKTNNDIRDCERKLLAAKALMEGGDNARAKRKAAIGSRRAAYAQVFQTYAEEEAILKELYEPLRARLGNIPGPISQLEFYVYRRIDVSSWVKQGEGLLDLRVAGTFRGRGSLLATAADELLSAWQTGAADQVADAMSAFIDAHGKDLVGSRKEGVADRQITEWLFATEHVRVEYGIRYQGNEIARLSPGLRGSVLLMLYLALDDSDDRPLLIDQPEENLDPKTVFDELVQYFRAARRRRQVILVTHNANLVVNTDADQVIVATARRVKEGALPEISYVSGSLENMGIREQVCDLLEGGRTAFTERERRYWRRRGRRE